MALEGFVKVAYLRLLYLLKEALLKDCPRGWHGWQRGCVGRRRVAVEEVQRVRFKQRGGPWPSRAAAARLDSVSQARPSPPARSPSGDRARVKTREARGLDGCQGAEKISNAAHVPRSHFFFSFTSKEVLAQANQPTGKESETRAGPS